MKCWLRVSQMLPPGAWDLIQSGIVVNECNGKLTSVWSNNAKIGPHAVKVHQSNQLMAKFLKIKLYKGLCRKTKTYISYSE